jgi:PAS domain S-box-containing protein
MAITATDLLTIMLDRQGRVVYWSASCERITGYSPAAVRGRALADVLESVVAPQPDAPAGGSGAVARCSTRRERPSMWWPRVWISPVSSARKNVWRSPGNGYRTAIECANDAIFLVDVESGRILDANRKAEELLGLPREKLIGMHQMELRPVADQVRMAARFREVAPRGPVVVAGVSVFRRDGQRRPRPPEQQRYGVAAKGSRQVHWRSNSFD